MTKETSQIPQYEVAIIGAGFGGMGIAIKLQEMGIDNIVILDRASDLGGTWHINTYPGLTVDIPSLTYSHSFEPSGRVWGVMSDASASGRWTNPSNLSA